MLTWRRYLLAEFCGIVPTFLCPIAQEKKVLVR
jgi:hypothetical protein